MSFQEDAGDAVLADIMLVGPAWAPFIGDMAAITRTLLPVGAMLMASGSDSVLILSVRDPIRIRFSFIAGDLAGSIDPPASIPPHMSGAPARSTSVNR